MPKRTIKGLLFTSRTEAHVFCRVGLCMLHTSTDTDTDTSNRSMWEQCALSVSLSLFLTLSQLHQSISRYYNKIAADLSVRWYYRDVLWNIRQKCTNFMDHISHIYSIDMCYFLFDGIGKRWMLVYVHVYVLTSSYVHKF